MADQTRGQAAVPSSLTATQADGAVGKIICFDAGNNAFKIGGDATIAAGNDKGAGYVLDIDGPRENWTIVRSGYVDDVTITGAIDVSADGVNLSFNASGQIVKGAATENTIGQLAEVADVADGAAARVFFNFTQS